MDPNTKQCPQCAEDIPRTASICPYCGAKFAVTTKGYCPTCHEMRAADANGLCTICSTVLVDLHIDSQLIQADTAAKPAPIPPPISNPPPNNIPAGAPRKPPKKNTLWLQIFALGVILLALYLLFGKNLPSIFPASLAPGSSPVSSTPEPSATPLPSQTPEPTSTPWPTFTPTPEPVEVSFDTIGSYDTDRLVTLVGRLVLTSKIKCEYNKCGLLLENPADTSQKITIFINAGDEPNQLKPVPETYTKGDIKVRLDDGTYALVGYRLRVTGWVCETTTGNPCITDIRKVELYQVK